jgi:hypothetical protein
VEGDLERNGKLPGDFIAVLSWLTEGVMYLPHNAVTEHTNQHTLLPGRSRFSSRSG